MFVRVPNEPEHFYDPAREVYSWAVHEPNTRRLGELTDDLEARRWADRA
jgi:hypothetical protein